MEFWNARFKGVAAFDDAKFHLALEGFADSYDWLPRDAASFDSVAFEGGGQFERTSFDGGVDFVDVMGGELCFGDASFGGVSIFTGEAGASFSLQPGFRASASARVSTGDEAAIRSIWPKNWLVGDDGVITERPVETRVNGG
ncbi:hypothetical protein [Lentzea sp. NPDC059081]|uniref:hypothetical protein n=1 Tax=Lentzea sp. NPDC059081 TaxID=3346719 RepID=UPI0036C534D6